MNILIVEDDQRFRDDLRLQCCAMSKSEAANVFEAATLSDALRILRDQQIDAVLSDGAFPPDWGTGMGNPAQWVESWRALYEQCKQQGVPFVLLSGGPSTIDTGKALGEAAFSKPCETHAAIECVLSLAPGRIVAGATAR